MGNLVNIIAKVVEPLKTRIMMAIARGVIENTNDSGGVQSVKASFLAGENRDDVERYQNFGFTSRPPDGTECVAVFPGGNREHGLIVATDDRDSRPTGLEKGESALYTADGTIIHLKNGGLIDIVAATKITITCPDVEMSGNLKVLGDLTVIGTSTLTGAVSLLSTLAVTGTSLLTGNVTVVGTFAAQLTAMITGILTASDVSAGGTSLSTIKSTYNIHTHPETGVTTTAPNQPL